MDGIQILFALVIELCKLITGNNTAPETPRPLSPAMRQEIVKLDKTLKEYKLLCENNIDSPQELVSFYQRKVWADFRFGKRKAVSLQPQPP